MVLWSGALGIELALELELFAVVSLQRDVWCRADKIWQWDNARAIEKRLEEAAAPPAPPPSSRAAGAGDTILLALSITKETCGSGATATAATAVLVLESVAFLFLSNIN
jgi:hypothetical protein